MKTNIFCISILSYWYIPKIFISAVMLVRYWKTSQSINVIGNPNLTSNPPFWAHLSLQKIPLASLHGAMKTQTMYRRNQALWIVLLMICFYTYFTKWCNTVIKHHNVINLMGITRGACLRVTISVIKFNEIKWQIVDSFTYMNQKLHNYFWQYWLEQWRSNFMWLQCPRVN